MRVLILGHRGMLGSMVQRFFAYKGIEIETVQFRFPSKEFQDHIRNSRSSFLINCIGAIPQKTSTFSSNVDLPRFLLKNYSGRIIHPGTDCEIDSDEYGLSKKAATDLILSYPQPNTKIIQTSIIGPELSSHKSLFDWFLLREKETAILGYTNQFWNGVTTLEWAKVAYSFIENWESFKRKTVIGSDCISKFELLTLIEDTFQTGQTISPHSIENELNKCLSLDIKKSPIREQLIELKKFMTK